MNSINKKYSKKNLWLLFVSASMFLNLSLTATEVTSITTTQSGYKQAMKAQAMLPQIELASINTRQEMVQYSRALKPEDTPNNPIKKPSTTSKQYVMRVTGADLNKGLPIATSSTESLVRISPVGGGKSSSIKVEELNITTPDGKEMRGLDAMGMNANSKDLQATPFPQGTSIFKFEKSLGAGTFSIKTTTKQANQQQFIVSVLEKNSPYQLKLETDKGHFYAGQIFSAKVNLASLNNNNANVPLSSNSLTSAGNQPLKLNQVKGKIVSPGGKVFEVKFTSVSQNDFRITIPINLPISANEGLWEVQVYTEGKHNNLTIKRDARLAFAYNPVTAIVYNTLPPKVVAKKHIETSVVVDVEYAGRYEAKAVLYSKRNGRLLPLMEARTAMWLETGNNHIPLLFKNALQRIKSLKGNQLILKDLVLTDQTRMSILPQTQSLSTSLAQLTSNQIN